MATPNSRIWCSFCGQLEDFDHTVVEYPVMACGMCHFIWVDQAREAGKSYTAIKLP